MALAASSLSSSGIQKALVSSHSKGAESSEGLLLMCLSKALLCLPSQESLKKKNDLSSLGNFQEE